MKKKPIIFIVVCMVLCLIPSVGMLFFPTTRTTENRAMTAVPRLMTEEGTLNRSFFEDFEKYFNEHMALRNPMVYADAKVQTTLFYESNVSGVICGSDGWLYYSSTLDDYLGHGILSDRALYNLAHNFSVVQEYLENRNIDFLLTIAPNKNTLYGEHMPYYKNYIVNPDHSAKLLGPYLAEQNIHYLDLFALFEAQEEVLYLRQDSHWNNKGACLVYQNMMDALDLTCEADPYAAPLLVNNEIGDLNKMLYSFYGQPEENYDYNLPQAYVYANNATSVEDGWIITENGSGSGRLLMFRDSFANTLIPFLSNAFETAYYSKGEPNGLERYVETYAPDCVVVEKVERNIANYLNNPPILTPPQAELPTRITIAETDTTIQVESCINDVNYYKISGTVDEARLAADSDILVCVNGGIYRAYQTGENGYVLYLKKADFGDMTAQMQLYIVSQDSGVQALHQILDLPQ